MTIKHRIILASASPRRKELLEAADFTFDIIPSNKEEIITKTKPSEVVCELSFQKAEDVFHSLYGSTNENLLVIGADTIVSHNGRILGKPQNAHDARETLQTLSGNTHSVYTGITLFYTDMNHNSYQHHSFFAKTDVTFSPLSDKEIDDYIATGDPFDKAGSYGIQGPFAKHVKGINGDYFNVVGLPINALYTELKKLKLI